MNFESLFSAPFLQPLGIYAVPVLALILIWSLTLKGVALWRAARNGQKRWFIVLLLVNGLGVIELIYLVWFSKKESSLGVAPAPAPAPASIGSEG